MRLCVILLLASACIGITDPALGKGSIQGVVTARAHKDLVAKVKALSETPEALANINPYVASDGSIIYTFDMVNYRSLEEIFVGYVNPGGVASITHKLKIDEDRFQPRSLAIATGDILKIENDTDEPLTFYVAKEDSDEILETDTIPPDETGTITVTLEGLLELGADENDKSVTHLLSLPNLVSNKMESGDDYKFEGLAPGDYRMVFWFWRLGMLERTVTVTPSKPARVDQVLSVDTMVR
ncbi:MAG: hypothetical protein V3R37_08145 [Rhodospirillales bacterium]